MVQDSRGERLRRFCFTKNNWVVADIGFIMKAVNYSYLIYGKEVAPQTGTPHLQGYCELAERMYFMDIVAALPGFHIEVCKGTQQQNIDYCKKGGDFYEHGKPRVQGSRTDLHVLSDLCKEHSSIRKIIDSSEISSQAFTLLPDILSIYGRARDKPPTVSWFYGPTGTGKTRSAINQLGLDGTYVKSAGTGKWWDGYDGELKVIIDDLRPECFKFNYLLNLLDRIPFRVEIKGSSRQFLGEDIIITCPLSPKEFVKQINWDAKYQENGEQLFRRLTNVYRFEKERAKNETSLFRDE